MLAHPRLWEYHTRDEKDKKTPDYATKSSVKDKRKRNSIQHAQARFVTFIAPPVNHSTAHPLRNHKCSGRTA
jgi:hypothetical protein